MKKEKVRNQQTFAPYKGGAPKHLKKATSSEKSQNKRDFLGLKARIAGRDSARLQRNSKNDKKSDKNIENTTKQERNTEEGVAARIAAPTTNRREPESPRV